MERLLLVNPANTKAAVDLAVFEIGLGNNEAALKHLEEVLKREPANSKAIFYRAIVFYNAGERENAEKILKELSTGDDEYALKAKEILKEEFN
ncbi:MAG TPA: tetratricopeptide repeat protein [Deltaproteobacteria bacterium]|nr:tetratricopeptide repeat protein [Deltaproteobacteria bacterium]